MKVTELTLMCLKSRRQHRDLEKQGYRFVREPVWQLHRGYEQDKVITDVKISTDGKSLYVKVGEP